MSSEIIHLSSDAEFKSVLEKSKKNPVICDFFATWCGPCMKLKPVLEEESKKNGITLCAIDVDQCRETAGEYEVSSIPHVILLIDGKEVKKFIGYDIQGLNDMINFAKTKVNKFTGVGISVGSTVKASTNFDQTPIPNEPPAGSDCYEIMFRYNNKTFSRRFEGNNKISEIKAYVRKEIGAGNISIFTPFPRKVYDNDSLTLNQAGLSKREALNVELK